jgi:hypothetical protein
MPYSPPNTFTTKLVASEFSGNSDALRVYLHEGIPTGDIAAADQFQTRHIVGPPLYDPTSGIQHGVTGHQGGLVSTSSLTRLTFTSQQHQRRRRQLLGADPAHVSENRSAAPV